MRRREVAHEPSRLHRRRLGGSGPSRFYRELPGAAPTTDLTLLGASEDGARVMATDRKRRALYVWQDGRFEEASLLGKDSDSRRVLCADARNRVVAYAVDGALFVGDLESGSHRPLVTSSAIVDAARSLPTG